MKPPNWDRIQDIYLAALALPHSERSAFVENACAGDPDCLHEVKSLLEAADRSSVLDHPVARLDPSDNLVGTTLEDRYEVVSQLPHGGMGKVYVARDRQLHDRLVVIKVLSASTKVPDAVRRFKAEVQALTAVDHPNVVTVLGAGELADGTPYIVMQYIDGLTLRSEISTGDGMDKKRAASLIRQIGAAVGHVHDKGILHRDLKPENIMLQVLSDGTEVVKVVDFGIAKILDSVSATSALNTVPIGTLPYMSPEQLRGGERITAASDIYSMAVVACEIITGKRPAQPDPAAPGKWRPKRVNLPTGLSAKAHSVLARALSSDPAKRYQSAKQFGDELADALLEVKTELSGDPLPQWLKKSLWALGGVLILAGLSYGAYWYFVKSMIPPQDSKGFNYWITVQRTHEGKNHGTPYKSNGNDIFDNGDKFKLHVLSLEPGYLYIFNESPPEPNTAGFRMIYPRQGTKEGSASVGANQTVESDWLTFRGPPGAENVWIVWSVSPVSELESAKKEALQHAQAGLTDESLVRVKEYLKTMNAQVDAWTARFKDVQEVKVRKKGDLVLTLAKFPHR